MIIFSRVSAIGKRGKKKMVFFRCFFGVFVLLGTFFSKKYFDPMEKYVFQWRHFGVLGHFWDLGVTSLKHIFLHRIEIFFRKKKYVAISPRSGAYVGERNLLLSVINRRFKKMVQNRTWSKTGPG